MDKETRWISSLLIYQLVTPYADNARYCFPKTSVQSPPATVLDVWLSDEKGRDVPGYPDCVSVSVEHIGEPVQDKPDDYPEEVQS